MKGVRAFAGIIAMVLAGSAQASLITDVTIFSADGVSSPDSTPSELLGYGRGTVNRLDGPDYVAWTHHFDLDPSSTVTSAVLRLTFHDDEKSDGLELAWGMSESGEWDFGRLSTATYAYDIAVKALLDGSFSVVVAALLGDFFIDSSVLEIRTGPSTSVPEPATLSLLGVGLLGAAVGCRRRAKKAR